jgi:tol-pal system protein YbgF
VRLRLGWPLALALVVSAGCASVDEFRSLEREVVDLKRTRNTPTDQQARLAELGVEVRALRDELEQLRGKVEELQFALEKAQIEREERSKSRASTGTPPEGSSPSAASGASGTGSGAPSSGPGAEVAAYEEGFRLYRTEHYPDAIARFNEFLQNFPSSEYADNALIWLGECYLKQGDPASAAVAFEDVVKKYPDGNKVPDALYRQGIALLEIGTKSGKEGTFRPAARQIFQRLVEQYPDSERAAEARRELEKLGT